jgi:hypothetical protein
MIKRTNSGFAEAGNSLFMLPERRCILYKTYLPFLFVFHTPEHHNNWAFLASLSLFASAS